MAEVPEKKERAYDQINGKPILHLCFIYQSCVTTTEPEQPACKNTTPPQFINLNCTADYLNTGISLHCEVNTKNVAFSRGWGRV